MQGFALAGSLAAAVPTGFMGGAYGLLSVWLLVTGGPDLLIAEFNNASTEARVAAGQIAPQVAIAKFPLGGFGGTNGAATLWRRLVVRFFGIDRQDFDRAWTGTWNPRPHS